MTQYLIATSVLETIVRGSLENDERVRVHTPLPLVRTHPVEIVVNERALPGLSASRRPDGREPACAGLERPKAIAEALGSMTGLKVSAVDVSFNGVFPVGV